MEKLCIKECSKDFYKIKEKLRIKKYYRSKKGLLARIFNSQGFNSKCRNHDLPSYTKQELENWLFDQKLFHKFYDNWVRSDYKKDLRPSIDRKDDNLPYFIDNIQLMTWGENNKKSHKDMRSGKLIVTSNPQKPVIQYDKQGNFINEYLSVNQAGRETKISTSRISLVCNKKKWHKTAGGFKWNFK